MAAVSVIVFGVALAASAWTLWATIAPRFDRIVALLVHGPVTAPTLLAPVPARNKQRAVSVRTAAPRAPLRAVA